MLNHKLLYFSLIFLLLTTIFSVSGFALTKTIVTVIEGEVVCFELIRDLGTEGFKIGRFLIEESNKTAWIEVDREVKLGFITKHVPEQLKPQEYILVKRNFRKEYQTEWDIYTKGAKVPKGYEYTSGKIVMLSPSELAEFIPEVPITEPQPERGVEGTINNDQDSIGTGSGPVKEEEKKKEEEETVVILPTEPEPPAPEEEKKVTQLYWVNPTANEYSIGGFTIAANGQDSAGRNGSNEQPWKTITYALTRVTGSTIQLVPTTYSTSTGETFPLTMKTNIDITGHSGSTIQGDGSNKVIDVPAVTGVDITNITIRNGNSSTVGGGIYMTNASVSLSGCTITSNSASDEGGGIYADGTTTLTMSSCTISNNTASAGGGGGIFLTDEVTATFTNCTISNNTADDGGGFVSGVSVIATFTDCTFSSNTGTGLTDPGEVGVSGIVVGNGCNVTLNRCKIQSNSAASDQCAIVVAGSGTANLTNCLITDNTGTDTAGLINGGTSTLNLTNCTIDGNVNGIAYVGGSSSGRLQNCIISNNSSYGIYFTGSDITISTCYFYSNSNNVSAGALKNTSAEINSVGTGSANNIGSDAATDPNFKGSGNYHLSSSSPSGTTGVRDNTNVSGAPSTDLDGRTRSTPDIGCYEYIPGDPPITGRIYDSVTGENVVSPTVGIYRASDNVQLAVSTDNPYMFNVDPGNYYIAVAKDGYGYPSQIVTSTTPGDHGDIFAASGTDPMTIDIPMDSDGWLYVEKTVNKKRVSIGEVVTYNIKVQNKNWYRAVENVELVDVITNGFKYVTGSTYKATGSAVKEKTTDPVVSSHKGIFNLGTVSANTTINLSYQVRVGVGIEEGIYKSACNTRKSTTGARNSNIDSVNVEVIEDPLFTRGTIIGKLFYDRNENGIQDNKNEFGMAGVNIYTEYGVMVETDEEGKYHIADVPEGSHLLKVDSNTLPEGARFTTDNPYFIKITEALLGKVNFGIITDKEIVIEEQQKPETIIGKLKRDIKRFFIIGLAEGTIRNLDTSDNIEMVGKDDRYDDGVHVDGKIALYLKGKVLGKYLITASIDTDRRYGKGRKGGERLDRQRKLFTNLDPDKYYPVYGDASKVDYTGTDTQDMVCVLIEWDESYAKWGSFHTNLPLYSRTLSGGIIDYISAGKTKYGDPKTELKGFGAVSRQKAAHDEFLGTGGSLYYLRHDNVIEGSEKLRVETRDRIGKITLNTIILKEEIDYELDYDTGRILLKKSLNSIQQGYNSSIISNDILMGERVYLIIDYEYYSGKLSNESWGVKGSQYIGNHVRVGGTYVTEQKDGPNYEIYGVDGTVRINEDTEINARYSHSKETQLGSTLSYDGGLSFSEQEDTFSQGQKGDAYSIDGKTRLNLLNKQTDIYLSYSKQDPYYSATNSISQQGSEKYIGNITTRLTDNLTAGVSHITQKYDKETTAVEVFGDREVNTTTAILDYRKNKLDLRAEYQHQEVHNPTIITTYMGSIPLLKNDFVAARVGYQLFRWLHPYIRGQYTINGRINNQGTIGVDIQLFRDTVIKIAETVGSLGDSTLLGVMTKMTEDTDIYANLEVGNHTRLGKYTKTTYGQSTQLSKDSKVYLEEDYSSYQENLVRGSILGYDKKITNTLALGLSYERSNVKKVSSVIDRDSGSVTVSYLNPDFLQKIGGQGLKASSKVEIRNDRGNTEIRQWMTENDILWRITSGITLSGRGNWGWTEDITNDIDEAQFYELGAGFAFRPINWDKLNILGKYSYITDLPPDSQVSFIEQTESRKHVYSIEGAFDVFRYLQLIGKFAYRDLAEKVGPRDWTDSDTYLYIARSNFHIINNQPNKPFLLRGWDLGIEYRILQNTQIEDEKKGFLVELDKDIGNYLTLGVGYNFTDYSDDLRNDDNYDAKGWFLRVNGKY